MAFSPSIRLTNIGYDGNVFAQNEAQDPTGDATATLSPALEASLRLPGALVRGRGELDFVYYSQLTHLRSIDTDGAVRLDLSLGRFNPYVAGSLANTRHRRTYEIDAPVRRQNDSVLAGLNLRLSGKSAFDIAARRSRTEYEADTLYFESDLARLLNRRESGEGITYRYAATPLTTVGVKVERQRDRFDLTPERDSNRVRVSPLIEFRPHSLVSGRVEVGWHRRSFLDESIPEFTGMVVLVDLRYTLLGRTRFDVEAERNVGYSYRVQQQEYQLTGFTASVTHHLADLWDVRGRLGRHRLSYITGAFAGGAAPLPGAAAETVATYGVELGYRIERTRLSVLVDYRDRASDVSVRREFNRVRVVSALAYAFD